MVGTRRISEDKIQQALDLRETGHSYREIAEITGLSYTTAWLMTSDNSAEERESVPAPPPEEIARRAAEIRKEWSPRERAKRAGIYGNNSHWRPPTAVLHEGMHR